MAEGMLRTVYVTERRLKNAHALSTVAYVAVMLRSYYVARSCIIPFEMWAPILLLGFLPKVVVYAVLTVALLLVAGQLLRLTWLDVRAYRMYVKVERMPVDFHTYVALMHMHMALEK